MTGAVGDQAGAVLVISVQGQLLIFSKIINMSYYCRGTTDLTQMLINETLLLNTIVY